MIDPTQNVLDLVKAESKYQNDMREAETRRINDLAAAEQVRINEKAALRVYYEGIIETMRAQSLKLLADQLKENKDDAGERMSRLEQFRWETGGSSRSLKEGWGYLVGLVGLVLALAAFYYK
jgi:hypothetical protein